MKKGKKNNEAPEGIDTTFLDTRVDNEPQKKPDMHNYMHHRNTNTTELFTQA